MVISTAIYPFFLQVTVIYYFALESQPLIKKPVDASFLDTPDNNEYFVIGFAKEESRIRINDHSATRNQELLEISELLLSIPYTERFIYLQEEL